MRVHQLGIWEKEVMSPMAKSSKYTLSMSRLGIGAASVVLGTLAVLLSSSLPDPSFGDFPVTALAALTAGYVMDSELLALGVVLRNLRLDGERVNGKVVDWDLLVDAEGVGWDVSAYVTSFFVGAGGKVKALRFAGVLRQILLTLAMFIAGIQWIESVGGATTLTTSVIVNSDPTINGTAASASWTCPNVFTPTGASYQSLGEFTFLEEDLNGTKLVVSSSTCTECSSFGDDGFILTLDASDLTSNFGTTEENRNFDGLVSTAKLIGHAVSNGSRSYGGGEFYSSSSVGLNELVLTIYSRNADENELTGTLLGSQILLELTGAVEISYWVNGTILRDTVQVWLDSAGHSDTLSDFYFDDAKAMGKASVECDVCDYVKIVVDSPIIGTRFVYLKIPAIRYVFIAFPGTAHMSLNLLGSNTTCLSESTTEGEWPTQKESQKAVGFSENERLTMASRIIAAASGGFHIVDDGYGWPGVGPRIEASLQTVHCKDITQPENETECLDIFDTKRPDFRFVMSGAPEPTVSITNSFPLMGDWHSGLPILSAIGAVLLGFLFVIVWWLVALIPCRWSMITSARPGSGDHSLFWCLSGVELGGYAMRVSQNEWAAWSATLAGWCVCLALLEMLHVMTVLRFAIEEHESAKPPEAVQKWLIQSGPIRLAEKWHGNLLPPGWAAHSGGGPHEISRSLLKDPSNKAQSPIYA